MFLLNGFEKAPSCTVIMAIYSGNSLVGVSSADAITEFMTVHETLSVDIPLAEYDEKREITEVKFFFWDICKGVKPIFSEVKNEKYN